MSEPGAHAAALVVTDAPALALVEVQAGDGARAELARQLGAELPEPGRMSAAGERLVLGLAADSWLLVGGDPATLVAAIHDTADDALAVDQSHGLHPLRLSGDDAAAVLSGLTGVDLSLQGLPSGRCAQTMLGHHPVIAWRHDDETLNVLTPRSYADSLCELLAEAR